MTSLSENLFEDEYQLLFDISTTSTTTNIDQRVLKKGLNADFITLLVLIRRGK